MNRPNFMNQKNIADAAAHAAQRMPQGQLDPKILKDAEDMKCMNDIPVIDPKTMLPVPNQTTKCDGEVFVDAMKLKYINPILSPVGQQTVGAMMIGKICVKCGKIFNPDEWLKEKEIRNNLKGGDK
jgi:hypothetical protein